MSTDIGIKLSLSGAQEVQSGLRGVGSSMDAVGTSAGTLRNSVAGLGAALAGAVSVKEFMAAADAVTTLQNKLTLATGSAQAAGVAYNQLFEIAQRSRVSFIELGSTFASISTAAAGLGVSQQRLLKVTEAIGNAVTISGSSAQSAQAALVQLGQGLASGTLRGEELNSVMEQTPRLAQALADGLGVSRGELRKLGEQGAITADQVIKALESQAGVLSGEVKNATLTVGQAFTQLQNSATRAVGDFDKATGTSASFASAISTVAGAVDVLGSTIRNHESTFKVLTGVAGGVAAAASFAALASGIGAVTAAAATLGTVLAANPAVLALLGLGAAVGGTMAAVSAYSKTAAGITSAIESLRAENERSEAAMARATAAGRTAGADNIAKTIEARKDQISKLRAELDLLNAGSKGAGGGRGEVNPDSVGVTMAKAAASERELAEIRTKLSGVDKDYLPTLTKLHEQYKAGNLTLKEYQELVGKLAEANFKKPAAGHKDDSNPFVAEQDAAKEWAKVMEHASKGIEDVEAKTLGLNKAQAALLDYLSSPAYATNTEEMRQAAVARLAAWDAAIKQGEAEKLAADQAKEAAKAYADTVEAAMKHTEALVADVKKQKEANDAIGLTTEALGQLEAGRLRDRASMLERRAALADEIETGSELAAQYRDQAAALYELADAKIDGARKQATVDSEKAVADEWRKTSDDINRSLTDALMRGFESGKGFAKNLRDTLVNLFKTMVLRPVINALVNVATNTVGAAVGSAAGAGMVGTAASGLSLASSMAGMGAGFMNGLSAWGAGGSVMGVLSNPGLYSMAEIAGALGPIALGVALLVSLISGLDDSGTIHTGGQAQYSAEKGTATSTEHGAFGTGFGGVDKGDKTIEAMSALAQTIGQSLDAVATTFGKTAGFEIATAFADDTSSDGAWGALRISKDGKDLVNWNNDRTSRWAPREFADGEEGYKQYLKAVATDVRQVMLDMDLPQWADDILTELGDTPSIEALQKAIAEINKTQAVFETLAAGVVNFANISSDAIKSLVKEAGGIDNFAALTQSYYSNYYSGAEQKEFARRQLEKQFGALGVAMPKTREEFRALMEGLDLSTESGRKMYVALLKLSGAFAAVTESADEAASAAAAAAEADKQAKKDAANAAYATLERSIEAQKAALQTQRDAAASLVDDLRGLFDLIDSSVQSLYDSVGSVAAMSAAQGRAFIEQSLQAAISTGSLPGKDELAAAITAAKGGIDSATYANLAERDYQRLVLAAQLRALGEKTGEQLSTAEQTLAAIDRQVAQLDETLAYWKKQIDKLNGIDTSVLSVADAVDKLREALTNAGGSEGGGGNSGGGSGSGSGGFVIGGGGGGGGGATSKHFYTGIDPMTGKQSQAWVSLGTDQYKQLDDVQAYVGKVFDGSSASLAQIAAAAQGYGLSIADIAAAMGYYSQDVEALFAAAGIPKFAAGGWHAGGLRLVGENGPELEVTGPSRIFTAEQTSRLLQGSGPSVDATQFVEAMNAMQAQMARLQAAVEQVADHARRTADAVNGAPEMPVPVQTV